jgi:serine/threonine protein kinase
MSNNFPVRNQDQVVGGLYHLGAVVRRSAAGSVYETEFGDDACPAVLKTRRVDTQESQRLAMRWENAVDLIHPNLLRMYAAGQSVVDDVPVSYVIVERADESLAGVLAERALSETETREMLIHVLAALRYLHKNGYAHSNLKPSNILATGDQVKLSIEDVTSAGDGATPADDMRALGSVVVQALTQEPPKIEEDSGPYILREASQPFTDVVRHCLEPDPDKRWTVDQVQARLDARSELASASVSMPVQDSAARIEDRDREKDDPPRRIPKWIYGGLAALLLIVFLVGFLRKDAGPKDTGSKDAGSKDTGSKDTGSRPIASSQPVDRGAPVTSAPALPSNPAPSAKVQPVVSGVGGRRAQVWSVIVAAYGSRQPAENRSRKMAKAWPNFKWSVSEQRAGKTYYLVVIGQNLSEDEAAALRNRAVASGLPRDAYIKKLP